jgi:hypothetical protein
MLMLVLAFQNCGRQGLQADGTGSGDVAVTLPQSGAAATSNEAVAAKVTYIEIPDVADLSAAQKAADQVGDSRLVISLQSGKIQLMDSSNNVLQQRCLASSDLGELKTILSGSKICEAQVAQDAICAMRMKMGYASLYADEKRVNLGEEMDSCGRGRKDLCGELSSVFKAYVSHVKANWTEMHCE